MRCSTNSLTSGPSNTFSLETINSLIDVTSSQALHLLCVGLHHETEIVKIFHWFWEVFARPFWQRLVVSRLLKAVMSK